MAGPGSLSGWFDRLWPIVAQASGVTLLVMLLLLGLLTAEVRRLHRHNESLVTRLLETKEKHITWLERYVRCDPAPDH